LSEANTKDWNLPLSKRQKLEAGMYIILHDFSTGRFPPQFNNRDAAYKADMGHYRRVTQAVSRMNRKPGRKLSVLRDQLLALNGGRR
jgi:hypothetical protein